jgi:hypothetical protein
VKGTDSFMQEKTRGGTALAQSNINDSKGTNILQIIGSDSDGLKSQSGQFLLESNDKLKKGVVNMSVA